MRFFVAAAASKPDIESASDADWRIAIEQRASARRAAFGQMSFSLLHTGLDAEWHSRKKRRDRNPVLREALDFYW
jgi:hypothetical protein